MGEAEGQFLGGYVAAAQDERHALAGERRLAAQGGSQRRRAGRFGQGLGLLQVEPHGLHHFVIFDQHIAQNTADTLRPELAESWAWSGDGKTLTFKLRKDVKWHDGKPFTSADVKCTFDMLMGKSQQKFRQNPRKSWYDEVNEITVNGDYEASFNLKRPQPSLLSLLASGYTPGYPCHVSPADMRTKPVGTGVGLGLSMVYRLVQENHGEIGVESKPGSGTRFRISFPEGPQ